MHMKRLAHAIAHGERTPVLTVLITLSIEHEATRALAIVEVAELLELVDSGKAVVCRQINTAKYQADGKKVCRQWKGSCLQTKAGQNIKQTVKRQLSADKNTAKYQADGKKVCRQRKGSCQKGRSTLERLES